jgi:hypothetical protein
MAIVKGPAMSLDASGALAGAIVFSKWKGRNYVRQLVTPANPRSGAQTGFRSSMRFLSQIWAGLTAGNKATWENRADDMIVSPFNAFTSYNQKRWRNFLTPSKEDPAAEISAPATAPTGAAVAGVRMATVTLTDSGTAPDWGYILFRSLSTGFTPSISNAIRIVPWDVAGATEIIDTPMEPETYFYRSRGFNDDGIVGALDVEFTVVIT